MKRLIIVLLLSTLILSACSSNGSKSSSKQAKSPVEEFLFGKASAKEQSKKLFNKLEAQIGKCMTDKGWEYYPSSYDGTTIGFEVEYIESTFADTKKRERFGYGASTLVDSNGDTIEKLQEEYYGYTTNNKNDDYLSSLSDEERSRYEKDLFGTDFSQPTEDDPGSDAEGRDTGSDLDDGSGTIDDGQSDDGSGFDEEAFKKSCQGKASTETFGDITELEAIQKELDKLQESFDSNKDLRELDGKWKSCLTKELKGNKNKQLSNAITKKLKKPSEMNSIAGEVLGFYGDLETVVGEGDIPEPAIPTTKELKARQKFEIELAKADYKCQEKEYLVEASKIAAELEEKLLKENKEAFESLQSIIESN